jgi:lysophospholipase L1-like esterase
MKKLAILLTMALVVAALTVAQEAKPDAATKPAAAAYWVEPMKKAHEGFQGEAGYVAEFGDSITYTNAFWKPVAWFDYGKYIPDDGLPKAPGDKSWKNVIKGVGQGDQGKGPDEGNYSGWTVKNVLSVVPKVLEKRKPEVAIIMVGTNDISGGSVPKDYKDDLEKVVQLCLDAKCVPVLNTIPPRRGRTDAVEACNKIIKELAEAKKVPLVDYCAEIMKLQPGNAWDGTIIDKDGVHPTAGDPAPTEENLKKNGYALRTWANFLMFRQVYFKALNPPKN